ncbi:MAG: site-specific DNA-methyltransferase [Deltaproteobacteria bacterium]|nr:site-specific DNA-methyltransferase [Deltaproteobacteria bacterium]
MAAREDVQRNLFADPQLDYHEAVRFYQHDVDWSNRLILGDSLVVMNSLAKREDLAGKVQMIYIDPPYGIKFSSNFQPEVGKRDVKDREKDLTREPEMVKAYRDTWTLGVHSYLSYLRDRLFAAKELLTDSGSIFVQIGEENLHRVRMIMDEVFGEQNLCALILFRKTGGFSPRLISSVGDYLLWYAKDINQVKYHQLFDWKTRLSSLPAGYNWVEEADSHRRPISSEESENIPILNKRGKIFSRDVLQSQGATVEGVFSIEHEGQTYSPPANTHWKTTSQGIERLKKSERLIKSGIALRYVRYLDDFPVIPLNTSWDDTSTGSFTDRKVYVVQTGVKVIERCLLMTTDPGDLVLDPTCGSGTTAYVAEKWGRRWITIDTSRVSIAIARQRLLTAKFDYFKLKDQTKGVCAGFVNKTVPHITLKSIAQNVALDPIFEKHEPILAEKLEALNAALEAVTPEIRKKLKRKLLEKERNEGKKAITDADRRRWDLPNNKWEEWEVPFDTDPDWPETLQDALADYRKAWRSKVDEVNECIAASAEKEELVDQPEVERGILRVSGPFTVEAVQPPEERLDETSPIDEPEGDLETFEVQGEPINVEAYLEKMIRLLRNDGVRFPNNKEMKFKRLDPLEGDVLHAEGEWENGKEDERRVAVSFGPQYGPVTAKQVEDCLRVAYRRGYDEIVFAGFSFDGAAQAALQENQDDPDSKVRAHLAHIRPDVNMDGLLKDTPSSQLFTVFGLPRTSVEPVEDNQWIVKMEGVDIYNPVENTIVPTGAEKVAAWFLDGDYDGRTFCVCQAFFPDKSVWAKLAKALKGVVDEEAFARFSGTTSLPFPAGKNKRVAVKVIDPRGNEVMRVHTLEGGSYSD